MSVFGGFGITRANARAQALSLLPAGYTSGRLAGDILPAPAVFSRAQTGGAEATALGPDGVTWVRYGANQPRFSGPLARLAQEPQNTNEVRNPLGRYIAPPTFPTATPPQFWSSALDGTTGTILFVGAGVEFGLDFVDVEYNLTNPTGISRFPNVSFEQPGIISAAPGQQWTASLFGRVLSGTPPNTAVQIAEFAGASQVAQQTGTPFFGGTISRSIVTRTLTNVGTTSVRLLAPFTLGPSASTNFVIRYYHPQIVRGGSAGAPILPATGGFGPATRGDDIITYALSALRIPPSGECSFLYRGVITALTGQPQTIFGMDDGTASNRFALRVSATGIPQVVRATVGSEVIADIGAVAVTLGVPFSCGGGFDGAGRAFGVFQGFNSGVGVAVTGGPTGGLINARVGSSIVAANTMLGEHERWEWGRLASDAAMQARVAAY